MCGPHRGGAASAGERDSAGRNPPPRSSSSALAATVQYVRPALSRRGCPPVAVARTRPAQRSPNRSFPTRGDTWGQPMRPSPSHGWSIRALGRGERGGRRRAAPRPRAQGRAMAPRAQDQREPAAGTLRRAAPPPGTARGAVCAPFRPRRGRVRRLGREAPMRRSTPMASARAAQDRGCRGRAVARLQRPFSPRLEQQDDDTQPRATSPVRHAPRARRPSTGGAIGSAIGETAGDIRRCHPTGHFAIPRASTPFSTARGTGRQGARTVHLRAFLSAQSAAPEKPAGGTNAGLGAALRPSLW